MKYSLNWLKEFVDINLPPDILAEKLTLSGFEVEKIEKQADKFHNIFIGLILSVEKHPYADHLKICKVDIKKEILQIVCGAPNVAPLQKVPVAVVGAVIPKNQHDSQGKPIIINSTKIRDVQSCGMICSAYELDIGDDKSGIMILDENSPVGEPLADYLGFNDIIFEIGVMPNRPDVLGHIGLAREISAITGNRLKIPKIRIKENGKTITEVIKVIVDNKVACPRYSARVIMDVNIAQSPDWLKRRLESVGIRSINNVVDVTNYVLMEFGHPLHAFDYDKISNKTVIVRNADTEKFFTTLDGKERELNKEILLIADSQNALAIAGIMGGAESEVNEYTKNVFLESAYFDPKIIRRGSKFLNLSTEASIRFERGTDIEITQLAVDRAAMLIKKLAGGEICKGLVDIYSKKYEPKTISLNQENLNKVLGVSISVKDTKSYLKKIEIKPFQNKNRKILNFIVPSFRHDLNEEIDLIEEVARIHGYEKIFPQTQTTLNILHDDFKCGLSDMLRDWFVGRGYYEIVTNSLTDSETASMGDIQPVKVANPISKEMEALRTSLLPSMLKIIRYNIFQGTMDMRLFEIGNVFSYNPQSNNISITDGYLEKEWLIIAQTGNTIPINWEIKQKPVDIFNIKGEIELLFDKVSLDKYKFIPYSNTKGLIEYGLSIEINGDYAGYLGSINEEILKKSGIEQPVYVAELLIEKISPYISIKKFYKELPKYPQVFRDIAVVIDESVPCEKLMNVIKRNGFPLLRQLSLFDVYRGSQIEKGKKSYAFRMMFQSDERTLLQEEVDNIVKEIIKSLVDNFNAKLRT